MTAKKAPVMGRGAAAGADAAAAEKGPDVQRGAHFERGTAKNLAAIFADYRVRFTVGNGESANGARLPLLSRTRSGQRGFGLLRDLRKRCLVVHGEIGQDLAVDIDRSLG